MCVPSPANISGECLHQGSMLCLKLISNADSHANTQGMKVLGVMKDKGSMFLIFPCNFIAGSCE